MAFSLVDVAMESPSKMALSVFKYFGVNVEDSVPAQIPVLETPALVAHIDMEGVASMDMEGVLQDSLQKFKKEVEDGARRILILQAWHVRVLI